MKGSKKSEAGLSKVRADIDAIDDKLIALLNKRVKLTEKAGSIKRAAGAEVFARLEREAEILQRLSQNRGGIPEESVRAIFREIISACLSVEKRQTICYLGPEHTFTHDAARKHFGSSADYKPELALREVFGRVEKDICDFAVVPFENSGGGTVGSTFDALLNTSLEICGEIMLRVRHNLLAASPIAPNKFRTVFAHPQALAQCRGWLEHNAPNIKISAMESNAAAAKFVSESKNSQNKDIFAAIASRSAAEHYGLKVIAADIEDSAFNTTRFFVMGVKSPGPSSDDKTSFVMSAPSKAGALYHLLEPLKRLKINMTKFESRLTRDRLWEYVFYVDIDGHRETKNVAKALDEIRQRAAFLKVLGSYPRAAE